jgi:hypothetical protein
MFIAWRPIKNYHEKSIIAWNLVGKNNFPQTATLHNDINEKCEQETRGKLQVAENCFKLASKLFAFWFFRYK